MDTINFTGEKIIEVSRLSNKFLIFKTTRPKEYTFRAGQFSRLGFKEGNGYLWRAYSIMSAEYDEYLEFFVVLIEDGAMSKKLNKISLHDDILLDKTSSGFFLTERFVSGKNLIMLATGSGIAPFLSQLQDSYPWEKFEKVYLFHSVSYLEDLISQKVIDNFKNHPLVGEYINNSDRFKFIPVITRSDDKKYLTNRIPKLIEKGLLAQQIADFNPQDSRIMICGNPLMVQDTFAQLLKLGFTMHRNKVPGNIIMENGF